MDYLRECAKRLDEGEAAEDVMEAFRKRYTTIRCVNVKACVVRQLCTPSVEYTVACNTMCEECSEKGPEFVSSLRLAMDRQRCERPDIRELIHTLPARLPENVRKFTISRQELRQCKRIGARNALEKNRVRQNINGVDILRHARTTIDTCEACTSISDLALSLMLLTGRRSCEILNGQSVFTKTEHPYTLEFTGQAKKRGQVPVVLIPVLHTVDAIVSAFHVLRERQSFVKLTNKETSRRYQSYLGRTIAAAKQWTSCNKVHVLRGAYACMSTRLFEWGEYSDAFVTMCILGHAGLGESLVYTPFHLGDDFNQESLLGLGHLTPWEDPFETRCKEPLD